MRRNTVSYPKNQCGQALFEYLLIIVLGVLVSVGGLSALGVDLQKVYTKISNSLAGQNATLFSDNFSNLSGWQNIYGHNIWSAAGGVLSAIASGDSRFMASANLPNDYQVNLDSAQLLSGNGYGVMFRLNKSGNNYAGYSFQLDPGYGNKFVFRRFDTNGNELGTPLAVGSPPAGFNFSADHKVSVSVVGNTFKAYVDNVQVLAATDSTYSSGAAGLRVWDSTSTNFSGFNVTQAN
ncbi:MAG: DUF1080 domain-containing protein [Chloroflexi bacterium]|nr:DUF1080 domain-containing protein [Chloroflexota bacterium]